MTKKNDADAAPAELIAAAHAGEIVTTAAVTIERLAAAGWAIVSIHLKVLARLPRVTQGKFIDAAVRAKTNCLVSRLLSTNISMNAKLDNWPLRQPRQRIGTFLWGN